MQQQGKGKKLPAQRARKAALRVLVHRHYHQWPRPLIDQARDLYARAVLARP